MNSILKTVITGVVTGLTGALLALLLASRGQEVRVEGNTDDIQDLKTRMTAVETGRAGDKAKLEAIESKVNDIWQVVVTRDGGPGFSGRR